MYDGLVNVRVCVLCESSKVPTHQPILYGSCQDYNDNIVHESICTLSVCHLSTLNVCFVCFCIDDLRWCIVFADEDVWEGIAILFVQLHVDKYAPVRAGFISYDCVVDYIINNVCSFE